jgi:hypothetical protein
LSNDSYCLHWASTEEEGSADISKSDSKGNKNRRTNAARGMIMVTKRARERARVTRWMATTTKRARARATRGMVMATRVAGNKKGNDAGNKEGNGDQRQQNGQLLWQRGWRAFDGSNDGDGTRTWLLTLYI